MVTPLTEVKAVTGEKTLTAHCVYHYVFLYKNVPEYHAQRGSGIKRPSVKENMG